MLERRQIIVGYLYMLLWRNASTRPSFHFNERRISVYGCIRAKWQFFSFFILCTHVFYVEIMYLREINNDFHWNTPNSEVFPFSREYAVCHACRPNIHTITHIHRPEFCVVFCCLRCSLLGTWWRCHVITIITWTRFTFRFVLFLPFHAAILEPNFDLPFGEAQCVGNFDASSSCQVTIKVEFFL